MTKKNSIWLTLVLVIFACVITFELTIVFGGIFSAPVADLEIPETTETTVPDKEPEEKPKTFSEELRDRVFEKAGVVLDIYAKYYVGEIDIDEVAEGAAEGIVAYMGDKYGDYHGAEEYAEIMEGYSGEFAGIGVSVVLNYDLFAIEILQVMNNSPALEAGLQPNDLIVKVGGEDIASIGYNEAINRIRGEVGTEVTLTIARGDNYSEVFDINITRRKVEEESITLELIEMDGLFRPVAYVRILDFNHLTAEQFIEVVGECIGEHKVHGFIFDLRNNGGGELSTVVTMLDALLPEGPIVRIQNKDGKEKVYESDKHFVDEPMVVLTNGNTASAAELFTAALRDYGRAIVVGETTFGKGTVQTLIPISDGSAVRVSSSMYLPPYSENFEGVGVKPDVEASLAEEYKNVNLFKLPHEEDTQLQAALNLYK